LAFGVGEAAARVRYGGDEALDLVGLLDIMGECIGFGEGRTAQLGTPERSWALAKARDAAMARTVDWKRMVFVK
jgi:hypothetical protein